MRKFMILFGGFSFGLIIGYLAWHVTRPGEQNTELNLKTLFGIIGALGGAAILALFPAGTDLFATYSIGLAVGFFLSPIQKAGNSWLSARLQDKKRKERIKKAEQDKEARATQEEFLLASRYIEQNLDMLIRVVGQKFINNPFLELKSYDLVEFPIPLLPKIQVLRFFAISLPEMFIFNRSGGLVLHPNFRGEDISFLSDPSEVREKLKYLTIP